MSRGASRTSRPSPAPAGMPAWLVWKAPTAEEFTIAKRRGIPNQAHRMQRAGIDTGSTRFTLSERGRCHPVGVAFADRYRIDEVLGTGAQKTTYLAWDTK